MNSRPITLHPRVSFGEANDSTWRACYSSPLARVRHYRLSRAVVAATAAAYSTSTPSRNVRSSLSLAPFVSRLSRTCRSLYHACFAKFIGRRASEALSQKLPGSRTRAPTRRYCFQELWRVQRQQRKRAGKMMFLNLLATARAAYC